MILVRVLIFIIVFFMVMDVNAQERHGWGGGWHHDNDAPRYYGHGWGAPRYDPNAVIGGAIGAGVGNWLWNRFNPPPPPVVVVQPEAAPRTIGWCVDRYRSYDVQSRSYLGYDNYRHSCP